MSRQVDWREASFNVGSGVLRGKRCVIDGSTCTTPTIRLFGLHGWLDNANTFDRLVPYLAPGTEVFVLDLPGHGLSDHLPDGSHYSVMTHVVHVRAVVLELKWDTFIFLAHSMGCPIASYYIALFPANVIAYIILDYLKPVHVLDRIQLWRSNIDLILKSEQKKKSLVVYSEEEALIRIIKNRMGGPNKDSANIDKDSAKILLPRLTKRTKDGLTWRQDHKAVARFIMIYGNDNWLYVVAQIKCPVLMFLSTNGFYTLRTTEQRDAFDTHQAIAHDFKYVFVEGGHHVHLTHPTRVAPALNEFLSGIKILQISHHPNYDRIDSRI